MPVRSIEEQLLIREKMQRETGSLIKRLKGLICRLVGHKWRGFIELTGINNPILSDLVICARCGRVIVVSPSPVHPNCRCALTGETDE